MSKLQFDFNGQHFFYFGLSHSRKTLSRYRIVACRNDTKMSPGGLYTQVGQVGIQEPVQQSPVELHSAGLTLKWKKFSI